jgi:integrase
LTVLLPASTRESGPGAGEGERKVRPFHDGRHTAITNDAAAGNAPAAIQARAGHADFSTTQRYIDLAGVNFRDEAERAERRMWGAVQPLGSDLGSEFVGADNGGVGDPAT